MAEYIGKPPLYRQVTAASKPLLRRRRYIIVIRILAVAGSSYKPVIDNCV